MQFLIQENKTCHFNPLGVTRSPSFFPQIQKTAGTHLHVTRCSQTLGKENSMGIKYLLQSSLGGGEKKKKKKKKIKEEQAGTYNNSHSYS